MRQKRSRRWASAGACVIVMALALSACSSGSSTGTASEGAAPAGSSAALPAGVKTMEQLYAGTYGQPPSTSPAGAKGKSVWWISCSQAVVSCSTPAAEAKAAATALGIDFHVADGKFNQGGAFTTAVRTALAAKPDAILLFGVACELTLGALQDAKAQGVKLMGVETPDCSDSGGPKMFDTVEQYGADYTDTPGLWRGYGAFAADFIINKSGGTAQIISQAGTEPLQKFVNEGFVDEIKKCTGCKIVKEVPYDSSKLTPNGPWAQGFRAALAANPTATAVYMPFDVMMTALGGAQAVKESGLKATIFGGQAAPDGLDFLRQNKVAAMTTARDQGWSAYAAIDTINRALMGSPSVPEGIGFQLVTADPSKNLPASGNYVPPIDYKAAYMKAWNGGQGSE